MILDQLPKSVKLDQVPAEYRLPTVNQSKCTKFADQLGRLCTPETVVFAHTIIHENYWGKPFVPSVGQKLPFPKGRHAVETFQDTNGILMLSQSCFDILEITQAKWQYACGEPFSAMLLCGVGKTVFLWFLLVLSVSQSRPTLIYVNGGTYLYLEQGVYIVDQQILNRFRSMSSLSVVLCLINMDWDAKRSPPTLPDEIKNMNQAFTVAASSPAPRRYGKWPTKSPRRSMIVAARPDVATVVEIIRLHPKLAQKSEDDIKRAIMATGANIRQVRRLLLLDNLEEGLQEYENNVMKAIKELTPNQLDKIEIYGIDGAPDEISHYLIDTVRHDGPMLGAAHRRDTPTDRLRSRAIFRLIYRSLALEDLVMRRRMFRLFSLSYPLSAPRGWIYEILGHDSILHLRRLEIVQMVLEDKTWIKGPVGSAAAIEIGELEFNIFPKSTAVLSTQKSSKYHVPAEANNSTFDSFIQMSDYGLAFQMTVGRKHTVKESGIKLLRERFSHHSGNTKHKLVFVIPKNNDFSFDSTKAPANLSTDFELYTWELEVQKDLEFIGDFNDVKDNDDDGAMYEF